MPVNKLSSSIHTWILDESLGTTKLSSLLIVFVGTAKLYSNLCPNLDLNIKKIKSKQQQTKRIACL